MSVEVAADADAIAVVLVEDHPVVVTGICTWFAEADPPITVVASGADPDVARNGLGRDADVVVMDLRLSRTSAMDALAELVESGRQVIVYTTSDDPETALSCLEIGAFTFLTKAEGERHLVDATRAAARGEPYTPPALAGAFGTDTRSVRPELTARETDVLIEWFQSESKVMVADHLGLSVHTVNSYLDRVRIKYANAGRPAASKAMLLARAVQDGLIMVSEL